jgi:hypothetical protein
MNHYTNSSLVYVPKTYLKELKQLTSRMKFIELILWGSSGDWHTSFDHVQERVD